MQHLTGMLTEAMGLWLEMGIYLIFGFAMAGVLKEIIHERFIARRLGPNTPASAAMASVVGVPMPLCSCSVIPVGLSLFRRGASRAATVSFLTSTPQTGVDSLLVTYAFLGPVFMIVRPIAAFLNGLLSGSIVSWITRKQAGPIDCAPPATPADQTTKAQTLSGRVREGFQYAFLEFPREISGWLVIGIAVAGVLSYWLPEDLLGRYLGTGLLPLVVMAVAGVPLYICATASVPLVAVLVAKGLSPGAALVFLMTGPATNIATWILIARALGRRSAVVYVASIFVTAVGFGWFFDMVLAGRFADVSAHAARHIHDTGASPLGWFGAVALVLVVGTALGRNALEALRRRQSDTRTEEKTDMQIKVNGMTCANCARHVAQAAQSIDGVEDAHVDLSQGVVEIAGEGADREAIARAIENSGYEVVREA